MYHLPAFLSALRATSICVESPRPFTTLSCVCVRRQETKDGECLRIAATNGKILAEHVLIPCESGTLDATALPLVPSANTGPVGQCLLLDPSATVFKSLRKLDAEHATASLALSGLDIRTPVQPAVLSRPSSLTPDATFPSYLAALSAPCAYNAPARFGMSAEYLSLLPDALALPKTSCHTVCTFTGRAYVFSPLRHDPEWVRQVLIMPITLPT